MKKIFVLLLAVVLTLALAACGGNGGGAEPPQVDTPTPTPVTPTPTPETPTPEPTPPQEETPSAAVGDIIPFGGYDWLVLDVQGDRALIITEDIIALRQYHAFDEINWDTFWTNPFELSITWAESDIRQYLNDEFFNRFSAADMAQIMETTVVNNDNPWFGTAGGEDTTDRIFLLSLEEVLQYFGDSGQIQHGPTESPLPPYAPDGAIAWEPGISDEYNEARIARIGAEADLTDSSWLNTGDAILWWLRSPGHRTDTAVSVSRDGDLLVVGVDVKVEGSDWSPANHGVRPALWLNLIETPSVEAPQIEMPTTQPAPEAPGISSQQPNHTEFERRVAGGMTRPGSTSLGIQYGGGRVQRWNATDIMALSTDEWEALLQQIADDLNLYYADFLQGADGTPMASFSYVFDRTTVDALTEENIPGRQSLEFYVHSERASISYIVLNIHGTNEQITITQGEAGSRNPNRHGFVRVNVARPESPHPVRFFRLTAEELNAFVTHITENPNAHFDPQRN